MSVLRCNRGDCENVMCDRLSSEYGYICHECFEELAGSVWIDIELFMASPKPKSIQFEDSWLEIIERRFKIK